MELWSIVTGGITSLVGKWFDNKKEKQTQKHIQQLKIIEHTTDWETSAVSQMAKSWKDEFLLIVLSSPFIAIFISPFVDLYMSESPYVTGQLMEASIKGLEGIGSTPEWYTYLFGLVVGASYGVKGVGQVVNTLRKGNK